MTEREGLRLWLVELVGWIGSRRSRFQMIADVLRICHTPTIKTHILYQSNMNTKTLGDIIHTLVLRGFLLEFTAGQSGRKYIVYENTVAARLLLHKFGILFRLCDEISKSLEKVGELA